MLTAGGSCPSCGVRVRGDSVPVHFSQRTGQARCGDGFKCDRGLKTNCSSGRLCRLGSAVARIGGSNINVTAETLCDADKFVFGGECLSCPKRGANCIAGVIALEDNFWFDHETHGSIRDFWGKRQRGELSQALGIYQCAPGSCQADAVSLRPVCTLGRTGLLCGECEDGYYATDVSGCEPCPQAADASLKTGFACVFLLVLIAATWKLKGFIQAQHPKLYVSMKTQLPEVLKLLAGLFQILGAFVTVLYRVPWPDTFRKVTSFTSLMTLDIFALPSIRCSNLGSTFYARFTLHLTSMLAITVLFVALLAFVYSRHNKSCARPLSLT